MKTAARYAVYFAPAAGSDLDRACSSLLGRCARTGRSLASPRLPGIDPDRWTELTAAPRHYGLHATLKPPFFLADGVTENELLDALAELAGRSRSFLLPPLRLKTIGSFLALAPSGPCPELDALARSCVMELDRFRRPPSSEELDQRRGKGLTAEQDRLLLRWGYPYVLEEFRFHLTLSNTIDDDAERALIRTGLQSHLAAVLEDQVPISGICVFSQPGKDQAFLLDHEFELARPAEPSPHLRPRRTS